jgi:hypothetical protein
MAGLKAIREWFKDGARQLFTKTTDDMPNLPDVK